MNCYLLRLGLDEENHQLSKKEMEKNINNNNNNSNKFEIIDHLVSGCCLDTK